MAKGKGKKGWARSGDGGGRDGGGIKRERMKV